MGCLFCTVPEKEKLYTSAKLWFVRADKFPVSAGHVLFIPHRHVANVDELSSEEWAELLPLIREYSCPDFNIGINRGPDAGQTVFHVHVHLFPRHKGDVENPRGGIRNFKPALVPYL